MAVSIRDGSIRTGTILRKLRTILVIIAACITGACSSVETCEDPAYYENAVEGRRLEAPDDLDNLAAHKELQIPEASPRPPRDPSSGCLDRPPTLRLERPAESDEET